MPVPIRGVDTLRTKKGSHWQVTSPGSGLNASLRHSSSASTHQSALVSYSCTHEENEIGRVLVGLDGSANSAAALRWAIRLAKAVDAEVIAVHAFDLPYRAIAPPGEGTITAAPHGAAAYPLNSPSTTNESSGVAAEVASLEQSLRESAKEAFQTQWLGPLEEAGIRYREVFEEGRPVSVLLEIAEREQVDLIVTGRRGLGSLAEFLAGSVSHHLVHQANRPVTVIPHPSEE
jgi:nucleotide-binding universal stress UspA family protein